MDYYPIVIGVSLRSFIPYKGAYLRTNVRNLKDLSGLAAVRDDIFRYLGLRLHTQGKSTKIGVIGEADECEK